MIIVIMHKKPYRTQNQGKWEEQKIIYFDRMEIYDFFSPLFVLRVIFEHLKRSNYQLNAGNGAPRQSRLGD